MSQNTLSSRFFKNKVFWRAKSISSENLYFRMMLLHIDFRIFVEIQSLWRTELKNVYTRFWRSISTHLCLFGKSEVVVEKIESEW